MKRLLLLLIGSLLTVLSLANVPRFVAAQRDTQNTSTPQGLSTEAWEQFKEERRTGDVVPRPDRAAQPAATLAPKAIQAFSDDWAWIVYQSYRDGNWEIYLRHNGQEFRLTNHPASDNRPRLNRGTTRVVFNSNRTGNYELYSMNVDGTDVRQLTSHVASDIMPVWSPDGTQIAFASGRSGDYEIHVMNADGSNLRQLTHAPGLADVSPTWSPDGTQIAWVQEDGNYGRIYAMNANGTGQRLVLNNTLYLADVTWSPDGTRLAFDQISNPYSFPFSDIYLVNADGSGYQFGIGAATWWVDVWAGGWTPDGVNVVSSQISYIVAGNQVYLNSAYVAYQPPAIGYYSPLGLTSSGLDMLPDCQTNDVQVPASRVLELPPYSRASGFNVTWQGADVGAAGLLNYDVQARVGDAAWTSWRTTTADSVGSYSGPAGQTVAFRSRARDNALNLEGWPANSDASTLLYTWQITGSLYDVRGYVLPEATLSLSPTALTSLVTDGQGQLRGYLKSTGQHTFTATSLGYGTSRPEAIAINGDRNIGAFTLPPLDEQIVNGGFEVANLNGWQPSGNPLPITTTVKHTGQIAAVLGQAAEFGYDVPDELDLLTPAIAVDHTQTTYLVSASGTVTDGFTLALMSRPITGTWSASRAILTSTNTLAAVVAAPDQAGGLHVAWYSTPPTDTTQLDGQILTCHVFALASTCDAPIVLSDHASLTQGGPRLVADPSGGVHAIWLTASPTFELRYANRSAGGAWAASEMVLSSARWPDLAVDAAQTVSLVSVPLSASTPQIMQKTSGGAWSMPEPLPFGQGAAPLLAVAPDGTQHVAVFNTSDLGLYYGTRPLGGSWVVNQVRGVQEYVATPIYLGVSDTGVAHLIYHGAMWGTWLSYVVRTPDGVWHATTDGWNIENTWVAAQLDGQGVMRIVWSWPGDALTRYAQTSVAAQPIEYVLTQSVTLPADVHHPTLGLWHRLEDTWQQGASRLVVEVDNGAVVSETLNVPAVMPDWTSIWADLSAWAGQTITVNVKLKQAAGSPLAQVYVDDVSLGSWRTPVVQAVSVDHLSAWTATSITVSGLNFIDTPIVKIGSLTMTTTVWLDAQTISLTVPALAPGMYPVRVYNPGGQLGRLAADLPIGQRVYLSIIRR